MRVSGGSAPPPWLWRVVFHGDSLTNGYPGTRRNSYPSQVAARRPAALLWRNEGTNGHTIADLNAEAATVVDDDPTSDPSNLQGKIVVIQAGANDVGADPPATIYAGISTYIAARQSAGARVIACTMSGISDAIGQNTNWTALNALIRANAGGADVIVDLGADPRLDYETTPASYADSVHLTTAGYAVVAELVDDGLARCGVPRIGATSRQDG